MTYATKRVAGSSLCACAIAVVTAAVPVSALAVERVVSSPAQLALEIGRANPGDIITLQPGVYPLAAKLSVARAGLASARITVRALQPQSAILQSNTLELFLVRAPYWTFQNIQIEGVCAAHTDCEHAFHIVGQANSTIVRNTVLKNFNAPIKANGSVVDGIRYFPNDVIIEDSKIYNETVRDTSNPVTGIDVVGGRRWRVRRNSIVDLAKGGGNGTSYSAFFKGNGRDGLFERNLLVGSLNHTGGTRIGLSFGGGGTNPSSVCELNDCSTEHTNGIMKNNILMNFDDVGIYLNEAPSSKIYSNLIYNAAGVDVRFTSTASIVNNIVSGAISARDGGQHITSNTLSNVTAAMFDAWFVDPAGADFALLDGASIVDKGLKISGVTTDFCGLPRNSGAQDIGAIEYAPGSTCSATVRSLFGSLVAAPAGLTN